MTRTSLRRRLERVESALAPPSKKPVLLLIIGGPGMPDEVREIPLAEPPRRKRTWVGISDE